MSAANGGILGYIWRGHLVLLRLYRESIDSISSFLLDMISILLALCVMRGVRASIYDHAQQIPLFPGHTAKSRGGDVVIPLTVSPTHPLHL